VWDRGHVVAETDVGGSLTRSYAYGAGVDNILAMTVHGPGATNTYYYLKDRLGSVVALTDDAGRIVESYRYDAWGNVLGVYGGSGTPVADRKSPIGNRFLWQGREYSWATGLYYFRARWYDPVTGRWLSNDPIGISGGLNQYVFCANNPVNFRDPFGLCEDDEGTGFMDWLHGILDVGGTFEPTPFCDLGNALLYSFQGEWGYAGVSLAGVLPYIGDTAKIGKYGAKGAKLLSRRAAKSVPEAERLVIGRGADLAKPGALGPGEFKLSWPPTGTVQSEWKVNSGLLRQEMRNMRPIRDASIGNDRGMYLNAERYLLKDRGWTLDEGTSLWMPPAP
jgi:RHS repeat-associated protein